MARPDAKNIPIFTCTAHVFKEHRDKALESGSHCHERGRGS